MFIFFMLFKYVLAILATQLGIVAENIKFWVLPASSWTWLMISYTSNLKPFSSIVSASSIHTAYSSLNSTAPLSIRSINLPGVATIIAAPLFISLICSDIEVPPYTVTTLYSSANFLSSLETCRASSLVGLRIKNFGVLIFDGLWSFLYSF